jgi:hypothetical protein
MKKIGSPEIVGTTPGSASTARSGSPNAPGSSRACARESAGVPTPRGCPRTSTTNGSGSLLAGACPDARAAHEPSKAASLDPSAPGENPIRLTRPL